MKTEAERRDHDVSLVAEFILDLIATDYWGRVVIGIQDGKIIDLRTEQSIKMATLRECEEDAGSDDDLE